MSVREFRYQIEKYLLVVLTREAFETFSGKADLCFYYQAGKLGYESFNPELNPFIRQVNLDLNGITPLEILLSLSDCGKLHPDEDQALSTIVSLQLEAARTNNIALGSAFVEAVAYAVYLAYLIRGE